MVKLTIWGAMAENEGAQVEAVKDSHPVLSVTNVRVGDYDGEIPFQTGSFEISNSLCLKPLWGATMVHGFIKVCINKQLTGSCHLHHSSLSIPYTVKLLMAKASLRFLLW